MSFDYGQESYRLVSFDVMTIEAVWIKRDRNKKERKEK